MCGAQEPSRPFSLTIREGSVFVSADVFEKERKVSEEPKTVHYESIVLGIPSFGKVSMNFYLSQATMAQHIFTNLIYHPVYAKPVDVARNEIAYTAINNKCGYVFFRDDDTIAPRDALTKMLKRFPINQRTNPGTEGHMVVGGVVYSKTEPPAPMIYKKGSTAGFEDWNPEDLVQCQVIGMGCTLIPTAVFRKTLPFVKHYRCVNDRCPVHWEEEVMLDKLDKGEMIEGFENPVHKCKHCDNHLYPDWFKTVRDVDDKGQLAYQTEDTYFLLKCAEAGIPVYADCGVLCEHEVFDPDPHKTTHYGYTPGVGPRWIRDGLVFFVPSADNEIHEKMELKPRKNGSKNGKVKFNLGSGLGPEMKKGYLNIDIVEGADVQCDVRNLASVIRQHGQADEIRAYHVWEHLGQNESIGVLREWLKALKPGKFLNIEVPDLEWACENFTKVMQNGGAKDDLHEMVIFGRQLRPGDQHLCGFYESKVRKIMNACKNQIESYKIHTFIPKGYNQGVIRIKIRKVKPRNAAKLRNAVKS